MYNEKEIETMSREELIEAIIKELQALTEEEQEKVYAYVNKLIEKKNDKRGE